MGLAARATEAVMAEPEAGALTIAAIRGVVPERVDRALHLRRWQVFRFRLGSGLRAISSD